MLLRFPNLKPFLVAIELNQTTVLATLTDDEIEKLKKLNRGSAIVHPNLKEISIKMIDANHCPGAAMLLISGPLGNVLHTGDFRYNGEPMLNDIGLFSPDYMYIDNTFIDPDQNFPTQQEAYGTLVRLIQKIKQEKPDS